MELAAAVIDKYGEEQSPQRLNLSYEPLTSLGPLPRQYSGIEVLQLNHCHLTSLRGIEQFTCLRVLSFKFNDISSAREMERLTCRETLTELNFIGNDIQHLHACRYEQLVALFPNLTELNNNDYRFKKIMRERNREQAQANIQTRRVLRKLDNMATRINTEEEDRRDTVQTNLIPDISVSRVEMVKSVVKGDEQNGRKKNLLISTVNNENVQVYQPTATFARQKNMEQLSQNFNFKRGSDNLMELLERRDDQEQGRMSYTGFPTASVVIFPDLQGVVDENEQALADAFFFKNYERKAFNGWVQQIRRSINLPKKKVF